MLSETESHFERSRKRKHETRDGLERNRKPGTQDRLERKQETGRKRKTGRIDTHFRRAGNSPKAIECQETEDRKLLARYLKQILV